MNERGQHVTDMRVGMRLFSLASTAEVIVVRPAQGELLCAGAAMVDSPQTTDGDAGAGAPLQIGKRYEDAESGLCVMCTKAGVGPLTFDGHELTVQQAKPLPSSD